MAYRKSIRNRRGRKKINKTFDLQITSMMDILIIILVFLLKSYQTSTNSFTTIPGIQIPYSASEDMPPDSLHLIVTPESLTCENGRILDFEMLADAAGESDAVYQFKKQDMDEGGNRILPLFSALIQAKENSETLRLKSKARDANGNPLPFDGVLAIQADKRVSYEILRKIMYTAGAAGYRTFRLLALRRDI